MVKKSCRALRSCFSSPRLLQLHRTHLEGQGSLLTAEDAKNMGKIWGIDGDIMLKQIYYFTSCDFWVSLKCKRLLLKVHCINLGAAGLTKQSTASALCRDDAGAKAYKSGLIGKLQRNILSTAKKTNVNRFLPPV